MWTSGSKPWRGPQELCAEFVRLHARLTKQKKKGRWFIKYCLLSLFYCGSFPAQPCYQFCTSALHTHSSSSSMDSKEFSQVWAGSSYFNFPFLSVKKHDRKSATDTGQVLPHITFGTLCEFWTSPQVIPLSPKCLSHAEQTWEQALSPPFCPSLSLPTLNWQHGTQTFLAHVWMWEALSQILSPSAVKQVSKHLHKTKEKHGSLFGFWISLCLSMPLFYLHHRSVQSQVNEVFCFFN